MKKSILILFFLFFNFVFVFSMEAIIIPTMSYSNYFLQTIYKTRKTNTYLHTVSLGLDLMFVGEKTGFTFFLDNHLSFMDETQVFGDIDFVSGKGASVVEGMIWDSSFLAGYTIDLNEQLKLRLGVGLGFFHGYKPRNNRTMTAMGSVFTFCLDYFFTNSLAIDLGIEEGVYGEIRKRRFNEIGTFLNRLQTKLGLAIRF